MAPTTRTPVKVVARYTDGRILKGTTLNFGADRPSLLLHPVAPTWGDAHAVRLADLKALFFVRDFDGDAGRHDRQEFVSRPTGKAVAVHFTDGEVMIGASWTYDAARDGFFLFPADPMSNNVRVFVVMKAVARVERLPAVRVPA